MRKIFLGTQLVADGLPPKKAKDVFFTICKELPITHISVFTENSELLDTLVDEAHNRGISVFAWKQLLHKTETNFKIRQHLINLDLEAIKEPWICPNNTEATNAILEELHLILENHDVDGLLIDVFRYPSPYYSLTSVLSCFCEPCKAKAKEMGIDWEETRKGIKNFVKKINTLAKGETIALKDGLSRSKIFQYISHKPHLLNFFKFRQHSISSFVSEIRRLVKDCNRELGLDTFTPSLSWLVGQDYSLLRDNCDWMKPMVYCTCLGPACMPAEAAGLIRGLQEMNPNISDENLLNMIGRFFEVTMPWSSLDKVKAEGFPKDLVRIETIRAKEAVENRVPIYTGIEAVVTDICSIKPKGVKDYVKLALDGGADGIMLSWDARLIPKENLKALKKCLRT